MRDHDPWFIPYGYEMNDWVVFWCTMLVVEPKEKLFIFYNEIPLENLFVKYMTPIRITLVKG